LSREPLLSITRLGVRFPTSRGDLSALENVSLDIEAGRTTAIVGESGSGKSVLSRAIMQLLPRTAIVPPDATIRFNGVDLLRQSNQQLQKILGRQIAMVFQDPMTSLNPVRTVGSQLMEGMRLHLRLDRSAAARRARELLAQVGISSPEQRFDQFPHQLSGGMRQRVVIAMAIACEPQLLIADEPTTALDVTVQAEILDLLQRLRRERQMAMILITHDLGVAAGQADDIVVMYAGQIVERAPARVLFARPRMPYTRALLQAIPGLRDTPHARLHTIPGRPPTVYGSTNGCRFQPRCTCSQPRCVQDDPPLLVGPDGTSQRCWFPAGVAT
jgi:peptide/nickel transport system ATP-binding protein